MKNVLKRVPVQFLEKRIAILSDFHIFYLCVKQFKWKFLVVIQFNERIRNVVMGVIILFDAQ